MNEYISNAVALIGVLILLGFLVPSVFYFFEQLMAVGGRSSTDQAKAPLMVAIFNALRSRKHEVAVLYREHRALLLFIHGVALLALPFAFIWDEWVQRIVGVGVIFVSSALATCLAAHHWRNLDDRWNAAQNKSDSWRVSVNGVDVGEISEGRLVYILKHQRFNVMNWIDYGFKSVNTFFCSAVRALVALPTIVFFTLVVFYLAVPLELTEHVTRVHQHLVTGEGPIPDWGVLLLIGLVLLSYWVVDIFLALSRSRNNIDEKIADWILMAVGTSSRGSVYVYRNEVSDLDVRKAGFVGSTST